MDDHLEGCIPTLFCADVAQIRYGKYARIIVMVSEASRVHRMTRETIGVLMQPARFVDDVEGILLEP